MIPIVRTKGLRPPFVDVGVTVMEGMHYLLPTMRIEEARALRDKLTDFLDHPELYPRDVEGEGPADANEPGR
jgi:hypothetical protein